MTGGSEPHTSMEVLHILSKLDAIRQFFGTPERPVTTQELTEFKKIDPTGFEQVAEAAAAALGQTI